MKKTKNIIPNRETDVRPLLQRETKMNTRKGMYQLMSHNRLQTQLYVFGWSQRFVNGHIHVPFL